jgi:hypothetical protein
MSRNAEGRWRVRVTRPPRPQQRSLVRRALRRLGGGPQLARPLRRG